MIKGKQKQELTREAILHKISEYDIYYYYNPNKDWELNKVSFSPFKTEEHPSFIIGNKYGNLSHIAFNNTALRGDCFDFVQQLYNLSTFNEVLEKIDLDFGLGFRGKQKDYQLVISQYSQPKITKRDTLIQVSTRKFTKEELSYWNDYYQDIQDLKKNNIYSIKELYLNKRKFPLKDTELRFGYFYEGYWKIYRPFAGKKDKWMPNNVPITMMDGKDNIKNCKTAFINKSKKDHMVISKVFECSCAVQNEGIACFSPKNVTYLKENSEKQILSFDSDVTGVSNSQQITQLFNFGYCNVPKNYLKEGIKDWALLAKTYDLKTVESVLKQKGIL